MDTGATVERVGAEHAKVVWPENDDVLLMDAAMAEAFAPKGIFGDLSRSTDEEADIVYEYGPPR